mmetsp:Transcript_112086/g.222788  ORF Transcript_112086/g.222788 Transcript_112086/m.222788 type:complete len:439 (+) Transcript_112086:56-1372(+)
MGMRVRASNGYLAPVTVAVLTTLGALGPLARGNAWLATGDGSSTGDDRVRPLRAAVSPAVATSPKALLPACARRQTLLLGSVLSTGSLDGWRHPAYALTGDEKVVTSLFEKVTPGVVSISKEPPTATQGVERQTQAIAGSGFVWDTNHVVTNNHVISGIEKPYVTFLIKDKATGADRRTTLDAAIVGADPASDVAVLRVGARSRDVSESAPRTLMAPLSRGQSNNLLVGQNVFAFGNPFGLEHSLSRGIISGVSRKMESSGGRPINGVIQTDASINPGNSGGPLLNSDGQVVGVNTAILTGTGTFSGVGLAIPIDTVAKNVESIIAKGFVKRPVLGIVFAPDVLSEELNLNGIMVMKVVPGGPAEIAGVRPMRGGRLGDVVVSMDGKTVGSTDDIFSVLDNRMPGEKVNLTVQRATADSNSDAYKSYNLQVMLGVADK